jgi:hypothetical protein
MPFKNIRIKWSAFAKHGEPTRSCVIQVDTDASDIDICNALFSETNKYMGPLWDLIEPIMPEDRSHTALSIGDEVEIDGRSYLVEPVGWLEVPAGWTELVKQ